MTKKTRIWYNRKKRCIKMKISCSQIELKSNLAVVNRAVHSRPSHPVLANVLMVADSVKGIISLTAFDLSLGIRTSFSAKINESGSVTLPAKLLNDIVTRLPDSELTLECDGDEIEDNPLVTIKSQSSKVQLRGMKSAEFPELPIVENKEALMLPIKSLTQGLQGVLFAASNDETKQVLTGVHLVGRENSLEFVATDGHRLAIVKTYDEQYKQKESITESDNAIVDEILDSINDITNDDSEEIDNDNDSNTNFSDPGNDCRSDFNKPDFEVTIPARALGELEKIINMTKQTESVALYVDEGQVVFQLSEKYLTSRKLDGVYPNYNQLIPREFSNIMVLDRKRLITSLERVAVLSDKKNSLVKFTLDTEEEQLFITVEAKELGNAKESNSAQLVGESLDIGFNIKYLMEGLNALSSSDIKFNLNNPTGPVTITPLNGDDMTYLIMPVQIRD
jgi:DNA polymerase-3 subunit beta